MKHGTISYCASRCLHSRYVISTTFLNLIAHTRSRTQVLHMKAFSCQDAKDTSDASISNTSVMSNVGKVVSLGDIMDDAFHNFSSKYQDYVQASNESATVIQMQSPKRYALFYVLFFFCFSRKSQCKQTTDIKQSHSSRKPINYRRQLHPHNLLPLPLR